MTGDEAPGFRPGPRRVPYPDRQVHGMTARTERQENQPMSATPPLEVGELVVDQRGTRWTVTDFLHSFTSSDNPTVSTVTLAEVETPPPAERAREHLAALAYCTGLLAVSTPSGAPDISVANVLAYHFDAIRKLIDVHELAR